MRRLPPDRDPRLLRSPSWLRFFGLVLAREMRRSFHGVRVSRPGLPVVPEHEPLVLYFNHASWWDGALVPVLIAALFPRRRAFGPIDADALERYGFMRRLGFFGVEADSFAGASTFLRVGRSLLMEPDTLFCVTPEGRFVDPRARPLRLQGGLANLVASVPRVTVLPLAIEYVFWDERAPEALLRFGEPVSMGREHAMDVPAIHLDLERRLEDTMDRLAADAISRDAGRFDSLVDGRVGVGGLYDLGRRLKAWRHGRAFDPAHVQRVGDEHSPDNG